MFVTVTVLTFGDTGCLMLTYYLGIKLMVYQHVTFTKNLDVILSQIFQARENCLIFIIFLFTVSVRQSDYLIN